MVPKEGESGWSTSDSGRATKGDFYDRVKSEYADRIDKSTYDGMPICVLNIRKLTTAPSVVLV